MATLLLKDSDFKPLPSLVFFLAGPNWSLSFKSLIAGISWFVCGYNAVSVLGCLKCKEHTIRNLNEPANGDFSDGKEQTAGTW